MSTGIIKVLQVVILLGISIQVILAGTLKGVQGDNQCKVLAAFSTAKYLELEIS